MSREMVVESDDVYMAQQMDALMASIIRVASARGLTIASVLDAGAHVGFFATRAADFGCHVVALEPNPWLFRWLVQNCFAQRAQIATIAAGLASKRGLAPLRAPLRVLPTEDTEHIAACGSLCGNEEMPIVAMVPTITFRDVRQRFGAFDLVKMDIQGAEHDVLAFTAPEDFEGIKVLAIEIHAVEPPLAANALAHLGFVPTEEPDIYVRVA